MRTGIIAVLAVLISVFVMQFPSYADFGTDELYDAVPEESRELLDESGVTPEGGAERVSIAEIWDMITDTVTENADKPLKMFASVTAVILLASLLSSVSEAAGGASAGVYALVTSGACTAAIAAYLSDMISTARTALEAASDFMLTYIPVFAGVAAAGGHTASATVFSGVTVTAIQVMSRLTSSVIIPLTSCMIGITAACSLDPELGLDKLCEGIKKLITWGLGLIMTLFLGILSVQTMISASADNAGMKTLKYAVSSAVPIVGGAVSDALSTVSGSIALLRTGIGGFGIAAGVCIMLPPVVTAVIFRFLLSAAGIVSDLFGCSAAGKIIRSGGDVMSVIIASLACFFLFITVSSAVLLAFCRS